MKLYRTHYIQYPAQVCSFQYTFEHQQMNYTAPWSRVLEMVMIVQAVNKYDTFYAMKV
jgi:hypothetical protein